MLYTCIGAFISDKVDGEVQNVSKQIPGSYNIIFKKKKKKSKWESVVSVEPGSHACVDFALRKHRPSSHLVSAPAALDGGQAGGHLPEGRRAQRTEWKCPVVCFTNGGGARELRWRRGREQREQ